MKFLDPEIFPNNYILAATPEKRNEWWPQLKDEDFEFKSKRTTLYNCLAWAINNDKEIVEMFYFQKKHGLDANNLDHSVKGYAEILNKFYGFIECENGDYEDGFEKIVLYGDVHDDWQHAARLLKAGLWVSKLGAWEDIEHLNLDCLNGEDYGEPKVFMKRKLNEN